MIIARAPVVRTENATGDVQIETSHKHGITHFLQLVTEPWRKHVGTLLFMDAGSIIAFKRPIKSPAASAPGLRGLP